MYFPPIRQDGDKSRKLYAVYQTNKLNPFSQLSITFSRYARLMDNFSWFIQSAGWTVYYRKSVLHLLE